MALPEIKVKITADTTNAEISIDRVIESEKELALATTQAAQKMKALNAALAKGSITQKNYAREVDKVEREFDQAAVAAARLVGATAQVTRTSAGAAVAATKTTGAMGRLGSVSTQTRSRIQQTSFQLQDIIVQLQGGTKASTALSQQLPQMAGAFGAVGAAIGVGVALGIPAVALAMNALRTESVSLEERLETLAEAVSNYREFADLASASTDDLAKRFGNASSEAQRVGEFLAAWARIDAVEALNNSVDALAESFGGVGGELIAVTDQTRQLAESILGSGVTEFTNELLATVSDLSKEFEITTVEAASLVSAMRDLSEADSVQAQVDAAVDLNEKLLRVFGSVEAIPPELREVARQAGLIALQAAEIEGGFNDAEMAVVSMKDAMDGIAGRLAPGIAAAKSLADELWDAAVQLAIVDSAGTQGRGNAGPGGPMGTVEQFLAGRDPSTNNPIPDSSGRSARTTPSGGGGGQERDPAIEALMESLKTEDEVLEEWRAVGLETLASANADELAALGGHAEAKLRLEAQYQERLSGLRQGYNGDGLAQANVFFGDMASAMQGGSEKMLRIAKVFGAAQSLINSYQAYTEVIKDPSLPWWARIPAAVGILGAGLGMVNAIKGVSPGGGGGAGAAAASPSIPSAPAGSGTGGGSPANVAISLQGGDMFGRDQVIGLINSINEAVEDGAIVRLV
jgi:hypothetical protein